MGRIQDALHRAEQSRSSRREFQATAIRLAHKTGTLAETDMRFRSKSILIGRASHNDVSYDPFEDQTVSAQHAEIRLEPDDGHVLYDMGSLNGTFVNGFPVRRAVLRDGDLVALGKSGPSFIFEQEEISLEPVSGSHEMPSMTPPRPRPVVDPDCPPTQEIPIEFDEDSEQQVLSGADAKTKTFLYVILAAILVDVVLNITRMLK